VASSTFNRASTTRLAPMPLSVYKSCSCEVWMLEKENEHFESTTRTGTECCCTPFRPPDVARGRQSYGTVRSRRLWSTLIRQVLKITHITAQIRRAIWGCLLFKSRTAIGWMIAESAIPGACAADGCFSQSPVCNKEMPRKW
jgi:hypothetical protein